MCKNIEMQSVTVTDGFWKEKQELNRTVTIESVYDRFYESGRIRALECDPNAAIKPHIYWDSDVAKWLESVAYILEKEDSPKLRELADGIISAVISHQDPCGYYNSYYLATAPEKRFTDRRNHELYCAGHWIEAAIAYRHATGDSRLYDSMCRYADYIDRVFRIEKSAGFSAPGHPEIELALYKLYQESKNERYLELARFFLDIRGTDPGHGGAFAQEHLPICQQTDAQGHSVRLLYLFCAVADIAYETGDEELKQVCGSIFRDITLHKMYISGGLCQNTNNEGFDLPYFLPPQLAYNETCASIAMCLFARRCQLLFGDSRAADVIEREMYNGVLSGVSLSGKAFFYENPLEIQLDMDDHIKGERLILHSSPRQRQELFSCSCCPPNITRFIASIGDYLYTEKDGRILIQQYISSVLKLDSCQIVQETDYPKSGRVGIRFSGKPTDCAFRIPAWCTDWTAELNGKPISCEIENGYGKLRLADGDLLTLHFDMPIRAYSSHPRVRETAGKLAFMRGPVLYCMEAVDNPEAYVWDFAADPSKTEVMEQTMSGLPLLAVSGTVREEQEALYTPVSDRAERAYRATLIPYACFANRGESNMSVWLKKGTTNEKA